MQSLAQVLDRLFPGVCPGCGALSAERICTPCWDGRPRLEGPPARPPWGAAAVIALGPYRGLIARSLRLLKYHGRADLARPLGRALAALALETWPAASEATWVPVPTPESRRRARGYDHAVLLAVAAASTAGARLAPRALRRVRETPPLHRATSAERSALLAGAFAAVQPLAGTIVLVDDILTTGATSGVAASALLGAGAAEVRILVVARA